MQGVVRSVCAGAGQMQRFTEGVFLPARGRARDAFRLALPRAFRRSAVLVARNFSELRKVTEMAEWKFCVLPAFRRRVVHAVGMRSSCCRRLSLGLGILGVEAESWLFGTWSFENAALRCALNLSARGQARLERRPLKFPSRPFESGTSRWDPSSEALTRGVVSSGRRTSAGVTPLSFFSGAWLSAKRRRDDRSPRLQSLVARR